MENIQQPNQFDNDNNDNNSNSEDNNNNLTPIKKKTTKKPPTKKTPKKNATNKISKKRKKEKEEDMVFSGGPSNLELCQLNLQLFKKLVPNLMINLEHVGFQDNVVNNDEDNGETANSMNNLNNINSDNNYLNKNNNVIILNPNDMKKNPMMINHDNNSQNNNNVIIHSNNIPHQQNIGYSTNTTPKIPAPKKKPTKTNSAKKKKPNPKLTPPSNLNQNNNNMVNIIKNVGNPTMINNNNLNNANISSNNNRLPKNYPIKQNNNTNNNQNNNNNNIPHNHNMSIPNNFQHNVVINNNYTPIIVQNPDLIPQLSSIPQLNHPIILHQSPNNPQYQQQQQHQSNFISHFNSHLMNHNDLRNLNFVQQVEKSINSLTFPLLIKCLNYLDLNNILEARIVNKQFHKAAMETTVWEKLHLDTLPSMLVSSVEFNREFIWNRICMWPLKRVRKIIFRSEMIDLSIIFSNYIKRLAMVLGNNNVTNCIFPNVVEVVEVPRNTQESSSNFQSILRCVDLSKLEKLKLHISVTSDSLEKMLGIFVSLKSLRISTVGGNIEEIYNLIYNQSHLSHVHFGKDVLLKPSLMNRMRSLESMTWYWDGQQNELAALSNLVNLKCVHLHFKDFQEHTNDQVKMVSSYYMSNLKKLHLINEGECLKYPIIIQSTNLKQLRFINSTSYEKWRKVFNQSSDIFSINSLQSMSETENMIQTYKENYFKTISYVQTPNLTRLLISSVVFNDQMLEMALKKLPCLTELDLQYTFNEKIHIVSHKLKILKLESLSRLSSLSLECPSLSTLNFFGKFQNSFHLGITSWAMREFVFNLSEKDKEHMKTTSHNNLYQMTDSNENIFVNVFQNNNILNENTLTNIKLNCPNLAEFCCKSNTLELDELDSMVFCGNTNNLKKISLILGKNVWREKISKKFTFNYPCVSSASFSCLLPPKETTNEDDDEENNNNANKNNENNENKEEELAIFKYPLKMDSLVKLSLNNFQIRQKWIQNNFYNNSKLTELILDNINVDTVTLLFVKEIFRSLRVLKLRKLVNTHSLSIRLNSLKHLTVSDCDSFRSFNQFECESLETLIFYNCPAADNLELSMWRNFHSLKILALGGIRINMFSVENFPVVFTSLKYIHYFPLLTKESNDLDSQGFFEILLSLNKGYFITFSENCEPWLTL